MLAGSVFGPTVSGRAYPMSFHLAQLVYRFFDASYGDDLDVWQRPSTGSWLIGFRNQRTGEAEFGRFAQAFLAARRWADFTSEADFAKNDQFCR